jgi:hypothetical protein
MQRITRLIGQFAFAILMVCCYKAQANDYILDSPDKGKTVISDQDCDHVISQILQNIDIEINQYKHYSMASDSLTDKQKAALDKGELINWPEYSA